MSLHSPVTALHNNYINGMDAKIHRRLALIESDPQSKTREMRAYFPRNTNNHNK